MLQILSLDAILVIIGAIVGLFIYKWLTKSEKLEHIVDEVISPEPDYINKFDNIKKEVKKKIISNKIKEDELKQERKIISTVLK